MNKERKSILAEAVYELEHTDKQLEVILKDMYRKYLESVSEDDREVTKSKVSTLLAYNIIKRAPDFDALLEHAETEEDRQRVLDLKANYYGWLFSDTNRPAKEEAMCMIFNELCVSGEPLNISETMEIEEFLADKRGDSGIKHKDLCCDISLSRKVK